MMTEKTLFHYLTLAVILLLLGCKTDDLPTDSPIDTESKDKNTFSLVVTLPDINTSTRVALTEQEMDVGLTWEENDEIQIAVVQGDIKSKQIVTVSNILENGKRGTFKFTKPDEIKSGRFELYAVYGGGGISDDDPKVALLPVHVGHWESLSEIDRNNVMLVYSKRDIRFEVNQLRGTFNHIGSLMGVTIQNTGSSNLENLDKVRLVSSDDKWNYNLGAGGSYDMFSGEFSSSGSSDNYLSFNLDGINIASGKTVSMWDWFPIPSNEVWPQLNIEIRDASASVIALSENSKQLAGSMEVSSNYHLQAQWNGSALMFTPYMTFIKNNFSEGIRLRIDADPEDRDGVWIDLNNNGVIDPGEKVEAFGTNNAERVIYILQSPTVSIYGNVSNIECSEMSLTSVDVSNNPSLLRSDFSFNNLIEVDFSRNTKLQFLQLEGNQLKKLDLSSNKYLLQLHASQNQLTSFVLPESSSSEFSKLYISRNKLSADTITAIINSLPDRTGLSKGSLIVLDSDHITPSGNRDELNEIEENHSDMAEAKNWDLIDANPPKVIEPIDGPSMTLTTTKTAATIRIRIDAEMEDRDGVWIDLNNNGIMDSGEKVVVFGSATANRVNYSDYGTTFTIYGKVTNLEVNSQNITSIEVNNNPAMKNLNMPFNQIKEIDVSELVDLEFIQMGVNELTKIDLSKNSKLLQSQLNLNKLTSVILPDGISTSEDYNQLNIVRNELSEASITKLINNLPNRSEKVAGRLYLYDNRNSDEQNVMIGAHVSVAKAKNWTVYVDNVIQ